MNVFKKYFIFMLSFTLQTQMQAKDFFYNIDKKIQREIKHYIPELFEQTEIEIPHDTVLISSDPNTKPSITKLALITQNPINNKWIVQYFIIENPSQKEFNSLQDAQIFTLQHLESGMPQMHKNPSKAPQKAIIPDRSQRGAWRKAHLKK